MGAATVVIAQPDPGARELLARIVEAAGQNAVRVEATTPPGLVDTTVDSSALILVLDVTTLGFADLRAVVNAFATRRYPAQVVALVDGPASAASAASAGAAVVLERPFHRDQFVQSMAEVLDIEVELPTIDPIEEPAQELPGESESEPDAQEPAEAEDKPSEAEAELFEVEVDATEPEAETESEPSELEAEASETEAEPFEVESEASEAEVLNGGSEADDDADVDPAEQTDAEVGQAAASEADESVDLEEPQSNAADGSEAVVDLGQVLDPVDETDLDEKTSDPASEDESPEGGVDGGMEEDADENADVERDSGDRERDSGDGDGVQSEDEPDAENERDHGDQPDDEDEPAADPKRLAGMDHSFTDILKRGRQL